MASGAVALIRVITWAVMGGAIASHTHANLRIWFLTLLKRIGPTDKNVMQRRNALLALLVASTIAGSAQGATFGTVVAIGGQSSDIALDEGRGVLYIANFTAARVDVLSLASKSIQTSMHVPPAPSSLALSPDGRYLVITHFGN